LLGLVNKRSGDFGRSVQSILNGFFANKRIIHHIMEWIALLVLLLGVVAYRDYTQTKHAIRRNFPVLGWARYFLETIGPELRQYIISPNNAERPFSRDQRSWVYASAKKQNNYFGFGTDNDLELSPNYLIIKHSAFPLPESHDPNYVIPCAKTLGGFHKRPKAFRPNSVVNVSGMSFGSLSAPAVEALNRGVAIAGALQSTGEGGISKYHKHGGDLIWQIGTGYFGCRNLDGTFSMEHFLETVQNAPVRAIEIKLSQGAKPGLGGVLPAHKVTKEIAEARGVPEGQDCLSPSNHTAFGDVDSLIDFLELLAAKTGLPVGIKSAVGDLGFWQNLAERMQARGQGPDFITIDGGEGGTGAAPLSFTDHVSLPFKLGFSRVYGEFARRGMQEQVVFVGSGKLGFPEDALFAFALGCDMINVAREAMLAIGCIQAQKCHTNHCPTGVATQNPWLMRGLDPTDKSARLANYVLTLRKEVLRLCHACGLPHPSLVSSQHLEILNDQFGTQKLEAVFGYQAGWGLPSDTDQVAARALMEKRLPTDLVS
jgi:glutamate synthase domain-containing protein 2